MKTTPKRRILCVDDSRDTCEAIDIILADYVVTPAYNKAEALQRISVERFDLILLDHYLPDGTGLDLCQEIRERDPITPILFFTATTEVSPDQFFAAGAQAVITKPEIAELLPAITNALFGHALSVSA
jgi:CheY-like chemotaxis protein